MNYGQFGVPPRLLWEYYQRGLQKLRGVPQVMTAAENITGAVGAMMHPVQTLQGLGQIVAGGIESALPGQQHRSAEWAEVDTEAFNNFLSYYKQRYGSPKRIAETAKEDPLGTYWDIPLMGGGIFAKSKLARKLRAATEVGEIGRLPSATIVSHVKRLAPRVSRMVDEGVVATRKRQMGLRTIKSKYFEQTARGRVLGAESARGNFYKFHISPSPEQYALVLDNVLDIAERLDIDVKWVSGAPNIVKEYSSGRNKLITIYPTTVDEAAKFANEFIGKNQGRVGVGLGTVEMLNPERNIHNNLLHYRWGRHTSQVDIPKPEHVPDPFAAKAEWLAARERGVQ